MRWLVTGASGFIGSNLVEALLERGEHVIGIDNFSTGRRQFLSKALDHPKFKLYERDLLEFSALNGLLGSVDWVVHLAANADVRDGWSHPRKDLEQNTLVTWNVLENMRLQGARRIAFSSTGSVYGEARQIPTPEDVAFPTQTSLYGASKLACEGLISAYCEGAGFQGVVFRFVSILGHRYTHGHVFDFVRNLGQDRSVLKILGDGTQRKSYLDVSDCVSAILKALEHSAKFEIYNLGTDEYIPLARSVDVITRRLGVRPQLNYTGGDRGWVGDNPFIFLDTKKIRGLGWKPEFSIERAVERTVDYLVDNPWVFKA